MKKATKSSAAVAQEKLKAIEFIESLNQMAANTSSESVLISLKVPKNLLSSFRYLCDQKELKYQTQIKKLMQEWVLDQNQYPKRKLK